MVLINLQDINGIFYEISKLDIKFTIPKYSRSISIPSLNEYTVYLIGGQGSRHMYRFDRDKMTLIMQEPLLDEQDRTQFSLVQISRASF